jgi:hypothetical protein
MVWMLYQVLYPLYASYQVLYPLYASPCHQSFVLNPQGTLCRLIFHPLRSATLFRPKIVDTLHLYFEAVVGAGNKGKAPYWALIEVTRDDKEDTVLLRYYVSFPAQYFLRIRAKHVCFWSSVRQTERYSASY